MSYISAEYGPQRYFGRNRRVDFTFRAASAPPDSVNPRTSLTHLVKGSETGGATVCFVATSNPVRAAPETISTGPSRKTSSC